MDGSHYDFRRELAAAPRPWRRRRLDAGRGAALMLGIAVLTFAAIVAVNASGVEMSRATLYVEGE